MPFDACVTPGTYSTTFRHLEQITRWKPAANVWSLRSRGRVTDQCSSSSSQNLHMLTRPQPGSCSSWNNQGAVFFRALVHTAEYARSTVSKLQNNLLCNQIIRTISDARWPLFSVFNDAPDPISPRPASQHAVDSGPLDPRQGLGISILR